jgi:hypothetical protein
MASEIYIPISFIGKLLSESDIFIENSYLKVRGGG